ncbi:MAG: tetratricopeptide repeat protein [Bacteroidota bacterium]
MRFKLFGFLYFFFGNFLAIAQTNDLNEADSLFATGNYSKAISEYKTYDKQTEVYGKIARAFMAIGNYKEALNYYNLDIEAHPEDALSKYEFAKLLNRTKNFEEAISQFNELIRADSLNPNYRYEKGLALEKLKDTMAIYSFHNAFALDMNHQKAIFKLAKHALIKRNHKESHALIDQGLNSYPENLELISLKAQNYYHQDYYEQAKPWFLKLLELGESSQFIHEKLSMIYAYFSKWDKAIEHRIKALRYDALDANGMFVLGTYYESNEDFAKAEEQYLKALKLKDRPLDFEYQKLGYVLNRQKKHQEAVRAFKKSLKENPNNHYARFSILTSKDAYYADIDVKIKLYEDYIADAPEKDFAVGFAKRRLKELKEEKFAKEEVTQEAKN